VKSIVRELGLYLSTTMKEGRRRVGGDRGHVAGLRLTSGYHGDQWWPHGGAMSFRWCLVRWTTSNEGQWMVQQRREKDRQRDKGKRLWVLGWLTQWQWLMADEKTVRRRPTKPHVGSDKAGRERIEFGRFVSWSSNLEGRWGSLPLFPSLLVLVTHFGVVFILKIGVCRFPFLFLLLFSFFSRFFP